MDISKLSLVELKALGFELKNQLEITQSNLKMVYTELENRLSANKKQMENTEEVIVPEVVTAEEVGIKEEQVVVEAPVEEVVA